jgi:hypothetical protein
MGGYTVSNQVLGVVSEASDNLLQQPYSGLMGLAFETLASSGAMPFWEELVTTNQWPMPAMAFYMARYRDDYSATQVETQGGWFSMGYLNESLYTGDVNYVNINQNDLDYWRIPVQGGQIQGSVVSIVSLSQPRLWDCADFSLELDRLRPASCHRHGNHVDRRPHDSRRKLLLQNPGCTSRQCPGSFRLLRVPVHHADCAQLAVRRCQLCRLEW